MSIRSYLRKLSDGVTGPETATCFPAALDCLLNGVSIPVGVYEKYEERFWEQQDTGSNTRRTKSAIRDVMKAAGGGSKKRLKTVRVRNSDECANQLRKWRKSQSVMIWIEDLHVVGLRPISGGWRMVGTSLPKGVSTRMVFKSEEIFQYLAQPARFKGKLQCNIAAFSL